MSIQGMDRSGGKPLSSGPSLRRRSVIPVVPRAKSARACSVDKTNPYESPAVDSVDVRDGTGTGTKRRLGLYDLAASILVVGCLVLLLLPEASHRGEPVWWIIVSGGALLLLASVVAGFAATRRTKKTVEQRVLDTASENREN
jgi:hypothetical protein